MSTQRATVLDVLLTDGRVLVSGSSSNDYSGLGHVDVYDPARGWSSGPRLDGDPYGAVLAPLPNGAALLAGGTPWHGGFDGPGPDPIATAMTLDPTTSTWTRASDMSAPRHAATATALHDSRVLVVGGYSRTVKQLPNPEGRPFCCLEIDIIPQASAEIFDPATRRWSPAGSLAEPRFGHAAVALKDGQVLVVGGDREQNSRAHLASAEVFDSATARWASAGTIGDPRTGFTLTALADGRALLAGGLAADGMTVLRSTLLYDPATNSWSPGPELREARTDHAAAALKDGRVLVTGGIDYLGRLAASEILDPRAGTWSVTGALHNARSFAAATTLQDGRVIVIGGLGSSGPLQDSEIFDARAPGTQPPSRTVTGPGRWLTKHGQPVSTYQQGLRLLRDGRVLVLPAGGYGDFTAQVYDPNNDTWTTAITRPGGQSFISAVALADDRVLILTLGSDSQSPGTSEIVDLATGASKPIAPPGTFGGARLDLLPDGRVWLTGGIVGDKRSFFFDPQAEQWSRGPDVPNDLYIGSVTPLPGGRILVGGLLQAMTLDVKTGAWTLAARYPVRWSNYTATVLPGGDVLLAGGSEDVAQPDGREIPVATTRVVRYNHVTGRIAPAAAMPAPRAFSSAVLLRDGRVLFAGGVSASVDTQADPVATAELYDPVKDAWSPAMSMPEARAQASAVVLNDGTVLEVGGYGLFNPAHTLVYVPLSPVAAATPAGSVSGGSPGFPLGLVVGFIAAALVLSLLVVAFTRRRGGPGL
jgi:N-acetylneuraminic acid mutarotase